MDNLTQRVSALEKRLDRIEQLLHEQSKSSAKPPAQSTPAVEFDLDLPAPTISPSAPPSSWHQPSLPPSPKNDSPDASKVMAWCAGIIFVLATLYFFKLVYETGWLTPARQIILAYLCASVLIASGFLLQRSDKNYAAYLPAVGLVVLYLTTFIAHLHYALISPVMALALVSGITLLGIFLGKHYGNTIYSIFSAIGVYVSPLLINTEQSALIGLVIYYSAWSLLFSFIAIHEGNRLRYLLPMYLSILGFDLIFRITHSQEWQVAVIYQLIQFLIFAATTAIFSIKNQSPLTREDAMPHGIALFIFYMIEYLRIQEHLPELVDYFAILSAVCVYGIYKLAKTHRNSEGDFSTGEVLVSYYCSWVAIHAVFFGLISAAWLPWAALGLPFIYLGLSKLIGTNKEVFLPIRIACLLIFIYGYLLLIGNLLLDINESTQQPDIAFLLYAGLLFGLYFKLKTDTQEHSSALLLYASHLAFMSCSSAWLENGIILSAVWTVYGLLLLALALKIKDKVLGKSALLLFAVAAFKVLLLDLSSSNSMTRVVVLIVVSASLYAGGWLYQSLSNDEKTT